jgi:hypothetical protein
MTDQTSEPAARKPPGIEMQTAERREIPALIAALTAAVSTPGAPFTDVSARLTISPDGTAALEFRAYVKQEAR